MPKIWPPVRRSWQNVFLTKRLSRSWQNVFLTKRLLTARERFILVWTNMQKVTKYAKYAKTKKWWFPTYGGQPSSCPPPLPPMQYAICPKAPPTYCTNWRQGYCARNHVASWNTSVAHFTKLECWQLYKWFELRAAQCEIWPSLDWDIVAH